MIYKSLMESIAKQIRGILRKKEISLYRIAKDLGVARESLHRSLMDGANPEWRTVQKVINYLGYEVKFVKKKENRKQKHEI